MYHCAKAPTETLQSFRKYYAQWFASDVKSLKIFNPGNPSLAYSEQNKVYKYFDIHMKTRV